MHCVFTMYIYNKVKGRQPAILRLSTMILVIRKNKNVVLHKNRPCQSRAAASKGCVLVGVDSCCFGISAVQLLAKPALWQRAKTKVAFYIGMRLCEWVYKMSYD